MYARSVQMFRTSNVVHVMEMEGYIASFLIDRFSARYVTVRDLFRTIVPSVTDRDLK